MKPRPLKVLFLTWDFPPARGGIQVWMFELARRLPDADVTVLAPIAAGARRFDATSGLKVRRLQGASFGQFPWLLQLVIVTLFRALVNRPDLIVCGHVIAGPAALLAKTLLGVPFVVFTHAFEIRRRRRRWLVTQILRSAAVVIANSEFTRDSVLTHGVAPEKIRIVYPGTDVTAVDVADEPAVGEHAPTILSVSRLVDLYKGCDTVIRALPLIRAKCPGAIYVVVGSGSLREFLERLAASLGVQDAVRFEGEVTEGRLSQLYASCDVFVQLSREARTGGGAEGFGIVCLEAGRAGKPVVAGRSGGLRDAIADGASGLLVDPMDIGAVSDAVVALLLDPERRAAMGAFARARVVGNFSLEHMAGTARAVFGEAAA